MVIIHSFCRDHFELEFYVRKLAKKWGELASITQGMGQYPIHVMMRQIMALFELVPVRPCKCIDIELVASYAPPLSASRFSFVLVTEDRFQTEDS